MTDILKIDKTNFIHALYYVDKDTYANNGVFSNWSKIYFTPNSLSFKEESERLISGKRIKATINFSIPGEDDNTEDVIETLLNGNIVLKIEYYNNYRIVGNEKIPVRFDYSKQEQPTKHNFSSVRFSKNRNVFLWFEYDVFDFTMKYAASTENYFSFTSSSNVNILVNNTTLIENVLNSDTDTLPITGTNIPIKLFVNANNVSNIKIQKSGFESLDLSNFLNLNSDFLYFDRNIYLEEIRFSNLLLDISLVLSFTKINAIYISNILDGSFFYIDNNYSSSALKSDSILESLVNGNHINCYLLFTNNTHPTAIGVTYLQTLFDRGWDLQIAAFFVPSLALYLGGGYAHTTIFEFYIATNLLSTFSTIFNSDSIKLEISSSEIRFTVNGLSETVAYVSHSDYKKYSISADYLTIDDLLIINLSAAVDVTRNSVVFGNCAVKMKSIQIYGHSLIKPMPNGWFYESISDSIVYANNDAVDTVDFVFV